MLGKSQNIQAGNCKRVKCDTWIKREVVPSVPKTFLPWWYRVSGTPLPPQTEHCSCYKASPCQALLSGNPSSDHLWMMHSSAFPFTHSFAQTCTHPEENCFHHSHFCTLEYYWAAFWMISFMLWPWPSVRNPAQCSLQRHGVMVENKQDGTARGLALTFQWPPITPPPIPCSTLCLFQSKSLWSSLKPGLESLGCGDVYLSWNGRVFSDVRPQLIVS